MRASARPIANCWSNYSSRCGYDSTRCRRTIVVPIRINAHTCSFMQNLKSKSDLPSWCSWVDLLRIQSSQATLQGKDPAIRLLLWYPAYGSVVVAHAFDDQQFVGTVSVVVLGLDGFHHSLQPRPGQATYDYTGRAPTSVSLFVGTVDETLLDQVSNKFDRLLSDAQSRHGAQRSAGRNDHQHTPAMIHALWKQASVCINAAGCTSASGAVPPQRWDGRLRSPHRWPIRNTSFPMVRSKMHWIMARQDDRESTSFRKVMLYLDLRVVEQGLKLVEGGCPESASNRFLLPSKFVPNWIAPWKS